MCVERKVSCGVGSSHLFGRTLASLLHADDRAGVALVLEVQRLFACLQNWTTKRGSSARSVGTTMAFPPISHRCNAVAATASVADAVGRPPASADTSMKVAPDPRNQLFVPFALPPISVEGDLARRRACSRKRCRTAVKRAVNRRTGNAGNSGT